MDLNEKQKEAVEHFDGPALVTSVPGSGKTRVLTERTARLIEKGINPKNILCITFTNKAAREMKERLHTRLCVESLDFFVGTFHAFCASILRVYANKIGYTKDFTILDSDGQKSLIEKIIRAMGKDKKADDINVPYITSQINLARENNETLEQILDRFDNPLYVKIAENYFAKLKQSNLIDFSGLLYEFNSLIEEHNDVLTKLQNIFMYIQVDEFQDTNYIQFCILKSLSNKYKNIMLIGDVSQSIYRFRGARYQNILDFISSNKDCQNIKLGNNYRSTPQIIKVADQLIRNNRSHLPIEFKTDNASGDKVTLYVADSARDEAEHISQRINYLINELGYEFSDIAILYRLNRLSVDLQNVFANNKIPFTVIGGFNYFDRKEIKDCLAMLTFSVNTNDSIAFSRLSALFAGVGDQTIGFVENYADDNKLNLIDSCEKLQTSSNRRVALLAKKMYSIYTNQFPDGNTIADRLEYYIDGFDYYNHLRLREESIGGVNERIDNVKDLIVNVNEFSKSNNSVSNYLQNIALITQSDQEASPNSVSLMTIHAAKGLEYPIVFMVGMEKDLMPHYLAISEAETPEEIQDAIEEERRICYVGMTRAEKHLELSYCSKRFSKGRFGFVAQSKYPSPFLIDSGMIERK
ncbi:MAG: UvrD-helicase domain-containing protein [Phenylobacterium sp.]